MEYLARLAFSDNRRHFIRTRWLDLIVTVLPLLRPLRMVDLHERLQRRRQQPRLALEARVMTYSGLSALLLGFAASLAVCHDERYAPGREHQDLRRLRVVGLLSADDDRLRRCPRPSPCAAA